MRRAEQAAERQKMQGSGPSFLEMQARPHAQVHRLLCLGGEKVSRGRGWCSRIWCLSMVAPAMCTTTSAACPHPCPRPPNQRALPALAPQLQDRAFAEQAAAAEQRPTPQRSGSKKSCEWGAGAGATRACHAPPLSSAGLGQRWQRGAVHASHTSQPAALRLKPPCTRTTTPPPLQSAAARPAPTSPPLPACSGTARSTA